MDTSQPKRPAQLNADLVTQGATGIVQYATAMMEPMTQLLGYAQAKGILDQLLRTCDTAVVAAAKAAKKEVLPPIATVQ